MPDEIKKIQYDENHWTEWPNDAFGVFSALLIGQNRLTDGPVRSLPTGLRKRRVYLAPILAPDIPLQAWSARVEFFKEQQNVGTMRFGMLGNNTTGGYSTATCLPFARVDSTDTTLPRQGPLAADPQSRCFQYYDTTSPAWGAQFVLQPTELTIDADSFRMTNMNFFLASAMPVSRPLFFIGSLISEREIIA